MISRLGAWLLKLGLLIVILAYEQVISLPLLTFVVLLILAQNRSAFGRQSLLLITGLLLATVYNLPLALGLIFCWLAVNGWRLTSEVIKSDEVRLLLISCLLAMAVQVLQPIQWTGISLVMTIAHFIVSILIIRFVFVSADKISRESL